MDSAHLDQPVGAEDVDLPAVEFVEELVVRQHTGFH
jgi:hypothetical protein